MRDFSRQMEVFNPEEFSTPVNIIGCGAVGSWVALFLAKLGIKDITVWDFDQVEEHNLPNQAFDVDDVGELKVHALYAEVKGKTGININAKDRRVEGSEKLRGIVFMLTDTMKSRKDIYEKAIKYKFDVKLLIETRMGLTGGRVYAINPMIPAQVNEYEKTLYTDEESATSACGTSQSIVATAVQISSMAVWQLLNWHRGTDINNELLVDCENNYTMTRRFE